MWSAGAEEAEQLWGLGAHGKGRVRSLAFIWSQWSLLERGWTSSRLPQILQAVGAEPRGAAAGGWRSGKEARRSARRLGEQKEVRGFLRSPGGPGGSLGVSENVGRSGRKPGAINEEARGFMRRMLRSLSWLMDIQVARQGR